MKKILIVIIALLFILCSVAMYANTAASFLKIGIGAKPSALGDAFIGIADDHNAILINPGGLGFIENTMVSFTHLSWLADTQINSFSAVYALQGKGVFGLIWENLNYGVLQGTDEFGEETEEFTPQDTLFALAFSRALNDNLGVGLNLKMISSVIEEFKASTFAFDIGVLYKMELADRPFKAGLSIRNIGGKMQYDVESDPLPMYFGLGMSYLVYEMDMHKVMVSMDIGKSSDSDIQTGIGAEYSFKDLLSLRLGYKMGDFDSEGFSAGLGGGYTLANGIRLLLDYAYGSTISDFKDVHRISFSVSF